jgi:tetratricopeptide (TPR) repeat protein
LSVVGLGGTGKTQVALQFAYLVKETQPEWSIFWMSAISMASFEQACLGIAKELEILQNQGQEEDPKELVKQHLSSSRAGRWLLVVDNADDLNIFFGVGQSRGIADYLPQSDDGVIVYTTRTPEVAELARGDVIEIGSMNHQDAIAFLKKTLTRKSLLSNSATAKQLLEELAYLPLAIAQAAAYLNKNNMSIAKYLRLLRNTERDMVSLLSREFRDNTRYKESANAVAKTWMVSFSQIYEMNRPAADLLAFMSCIEWKAIPRSLLPCAQSEVEMEEAIGMLCGYSLITRRSDDTKDSRQDDHDSVEEEDESEGGGKEHGDDEEEHDEEEHDEEEAEEWYDIHRLVHLATKIWTLENGDAAKVTEKAVMHVADVFPSDDYKNQKLWRSYLPHALRLLAASQDCSVSLKSVLCFWVGRCLQFDGRIKEAVKLLEDCFQLRDTLDEDNPDRLSSQHVLAGAYLQDRQVQKAVELLEHIVRVEEVLAEDRPDRLASQHVLASAYLEDRQVQKAVDLLEHVVRVREVLAEDHPSRLASQHVLASAYLEDRQVQKAVELLEHVVRVREVLAEDHPSRLASQHVLASAYLEDRQVQKAVELLEHVVRVQEVLAEDHPSRLVSQHELARAYLEDRQAQKAVDMLEHVVRVREVLAEDHPHRLASQHALAIAYWEDGWLQKAVGILERVVEVEARVLRDDDPSRATSVKMLRKMYEALAIESGDGLSTASG